jgi:hypothetical protein
MLPLDLAWISSLSSSKGTKTFVLSIVNDPSLNGIIFIKKVKVKSQK